MSLTAMLLLIFTTPAQASNYQTIDPHRILDTRYGLGAPKAQCRPAAPSWCKSSMPASRAAGAAGRRS